MAAHLKCHTDSGFDVQHPSCCVHTKHTNDTRACVSHHDHQSISTHGVAVRRRLWVGCDTPASLLAISRLTSNKLCNVLTRRHSCCGVAMYALQHMSPDRAAAAPKALPRKAGHAFTRYCSWPWCSSLTGLSREAIGSDTLPVRACIVFSVAAPLRHWSLTSFGKQSTCTNSIVSPRLEMACAALYLQMVHEACSEATHARTVSQIGTPKSSHAGMAGKTLGGIGAFKT